MSDEGSSPFKNPIQWFFRSSLLVLVAMLALTYSMDLLRDLLPWLIGIALIVGVGWAAIAFIRWRRSQW
ncbi:hypothetical protein [Nocardiopsis lambiniae]|uniref:DUF4175 domain-containing protein n=1 Tax=Nocardiopsis lambiniae TaxID=3075539 RepID=A0ABU2MDY1_9ACTN|nr:hypothetical protein [Nocardiopsis sp. DSM 44743]MDT0330893.1 hypothetical protein [Nocardiopsis sp. DSM 44743]